MTWLEFLGIPNIPLSMGEDPSTGRILRSYPSEWEGERYRYADGWQIWKRDAPTPGKIGPGGINPNDPLSTLRVGPGGINPNITAPLHTDIRPIEIDKPVGAYLSETGEIVDVTKDTGIIRTLKDNLPLSKMIGAIVLCLVLYGAYKLLRGR